MTNGRDRWAKMWHPERFATSQKGKVGIEPGIKRKTVLKAPFLSTFHTPQTMKKLSALHLLFASTRHISILLIFEPSVTLFGQLGTFRALEL